MITAVTIFSLPLIVIITRNMTKISLLTSKLTIMEPNNDDIVGEAVNDADRGNNDEDADEAVIDDEDDNADNDENEEEGEEEADISDDDDDADHTNNEL